MKNVCVNFLRYNSWFCMHSFASIHISLSVCVFILNISKGNKLRGGFFVSNGNVFRKLLYTIELMKVCRWLCTLRVNQILKKLFADIYMYMDYLPCMAAALSLCSCTASDCFRSALLISMSSSW